MLRSAEKSDLLGSTADIRNLGFGKHERLLGQRIKRRLNLFTVRGRFVALLRRRTSTVVVPGSRCTSFRLLATCRAQAEELAVRVDKASALISSMQDRRMKDGVFDAKRFGGLRRQREGDMFRSAFAEILRQETRLAHQLDFLVLALRFRSGGLQKIHLANLILELLDVCIATTTESLLSLAVLFGAFGNSARQQEARTAGALDSLETPCSRPCYSTHLAALTAGSSSTKSPFWSLGASGSSASAAMTFAISSAA